MTKSLLDLLSGMETTSQNAGMFGLSSNVKLKSILKDLSQKSKFWSIVLSYIARPMDLSSEQPKSQYPLTANRS